MGFEKKGSGLEIHVEDSERGIVMRKKYSDSEVTIFSLELEQGVFEINVHQSLDEDDDKIVWKIDSLKPKADIDGISDLAREALDSYRQLIFSRSSSNIKIDNEGL